MAKSLVHSQAREFLEPENLKHVITLGCRRSAWSFFSTDESVTEQLVRCFGVIATLSCQLSHCPGRDASMISLCKATLPTGYFTRILNNSSWTSCASGLQATSDRGSLKSTSGTLLSFGFICSYLRRLSKQCRQLFASYVLVALFYYFFPCFFPSLTYFQIRSDF